MSTLTINLVNDTKNNPTPLQVSRVSILTTLFVTSKKCRLIPLKHNIVITITPKHFSYM